MWMMLLEAACIGAHLQKSVSDQPEAGFRQRDVRFLIDLFWNWQSSPLQRQELEAVHNTQISRHLQRLTEEGWATAARGKAQPVYRLTRAGCLGLLESLRASASSGSFERYLFASYFLKAYRHRVVSMTEQGSKLPLSFRREITELFDPNQLRKARIQKVEKEIAYWEQRIRETLQALDFLESSMAASARQRKPWGELVSEFERRFPYEMNAQKSMSQALRETPEDLQRWELLEGNRARIETLWNPQLRVLQAQLQWLKDEARA